MKMFKKLMAMLMSVAMLASISACGTNGGNEDAPSDFKVGVVLLGDENEGYTYAHIEGIQKACEALGVKENQVIWKYNIPEDEKCRDAAVDLADQGCNVIFSNSFGHQSHMQEVAAQYPDIPFVAMTGDTAASSGLENLSNAFTNVFESRYVSGVVAGMKLKELIETNALGETAFDADGNIKIGYVGAYPYAEVVSGYSAFYLGVKSVVENVVMSVSYTNSWFDIIAEGEAANSLMADGCVIIGQHADSTGAPSAVQAAHEKGNVAYSVGYNIDMLSVAPDVALTSATNVWKVYYQYAIDAAMKGEKIATDWSKGYADDAVAITKLGPACAEGTAEKVEEVISAIKDGSLKVFDTSKFTVGGQTISSYDKVFGFEGNEMISDGYFHEGELRAAPCFDIRIDGITELNAE